MAASQTESSAATTPAKGGSSNRHNAAQHSVRLSITDSEGSASYALGPDSMPLSPSMAEVSGAAATDSDSSAAKVLLKDSVADALLMHYSARLCVNGEVRDQAAVLANALAEPPIAVLSGTLCEHRGIRHVINTLGGVPILCFLLAQVGFASNESRGGGGTSHLC